MYKRHTKQTRKRVKHTRPEGVKRARSHDTTEQDVEICSTVGILYDVGDLSDFSDIDEETLLAELFNDL